MEALTVLQRLLDNYKIAETGDNITARISAEGETFWIEFGQSAINADSANDAVSMALSETIDNITNLTFVQK